MKFGIFVNQKWPNSNNFTWFNLLVDYYSKDRRMDILFHMKISKNFCCKDILKGGSEAQTTVKKKIRTVRYHKLEFSLGFSSFTMAHKSMLPMHAPWKLEGLKGH